jgi:hypothetical protein
MAGRCRVCGRERFLPEAGPPVCPDCRPEPGTFATDRETGETVVVAAFPGGRADRADAGGRTVAEHPTNAGYPQDDPVVEAVYPFGPGPAPTERRRYRFPLARLALRDEQLLGRDWERD